MAKQTTLQGSVKLLRKFDEKLSKKAILIVTQEWFKDSTKYVYKDLGDLQDSGQANSQFAQGLIVWKTPYARRRFYEGGNPGDGNRKARARWSDVSKSENLKKYKKIIAKVSNQVKKEVYR